MLNEGQSQELVMPYVVYLYVEQETPLDENCHGEKSHKNQA